jgi:hypothetical protein
MAYGLVPLRIEDYRPSQAKAGTSTTEADFKAAEKLKLRGAAIADRLNATDHIRRKAHRDLAIWYSELGKEEKAKKEKQILFKLIGSSDDRLLYPQSQTCGHPVWWEMHQRGPIIKCGIG